MVWAPRDINACNISSLDHIVPPEQVHKTNKHKLCQVKLSLFETTVYTPILFCLF